MHIYFYVYVSLSLTGGVLKELKNCPKFGKNRLFKKGAQKKR
jgi:hypothetical protein